jgi:hypothetical protein
LLAHVVAIIVAFVVYWFVRLLTYIASLFLIDFLYTKAPGWSDNWPLVVGWSQIGELLFWAYPLSVALTTAFVFWNGWPRETARLILYLLVLVIAGPLTYVNYYARDQWLNLWLQSGLNLIIAFCGYAVVLKIRNVRTNSADAIALQSLSILIITCLLI